MIMFYYCITRHLGTRNIFELENTQLPTRSKVRCLCWMRAVDNADLHFVVTKQKNKIKKKSVSLWWTKSCTPFSVLSTNAPNPPALSSLVGLICMLNQSDIALPVIEVPSGQFKVEHAINLRWSLPFISGSAIYALMKPTIVNPSTCLAKQQVWTRPWLIQ